MSLQETEIMTTKLISTLAIIVSLFLNYSFAAQPGYDQTIDILNHFGPITHQSSEEDLKRIFGGVDRTSTDDELREDATQVNLDDVTITIEWKNNFRNPRMIRIQGNSGKKSEWVTIEGVRLGMTVPEVESINGKPFKDEFGTECCAPECPSVSWESGKLPAQLDLLFVPPEIKQPGVQDEYDNCEDRLSSDPNVRKLKYTVGVLSVKW